jgi:hypothetical protein
MRAPPKSKAPVDLLPFVSTHPPHPDKIWHTQTGHGSSLQNWNYPTAVPRWESLHRGFRSTLPMVSCPAPASTSRQPHACSSSPTLSVSCFVGERRSRRLALDPSPRPRVVRHVTDVLTQAEHALIVRSVTNASSSTALPLPRSIPIRLCRFLLDTLSPPLPSAEEPASASDE